MAMRPTVGQIMRDVHVNCKYTSQEGTQYAVTRFQFFPSGVFVGQLEVDENPDGSKADLSFENSADITGCERYKECSEQKVTLQESEEDTEVDKPMTSHRIDDCSGVGRLIVSHEGYDQECDISLASTEIEEDPEVDRLMTSQDGGKDLDVERPVKAQEDFFITIKHRLATTLKNVGEQIWNGSLLLSDFLCAKSADICGRHVVELGAGAGLSSIVAAMYAASVYCTDVGDNVLQLARENVSSAFTCPTLPRPLCPVRVRQLDWFSDFAVVYDFDLTDAFLNTVLAISERTPNLVAYIALEKRIVFTISDLQEVSPAYNYFRLQLDDIISGAVKDHIFKENNGCALITYSDIMLRYIPYRREVQNGCLATY
ncbi:MET22-like protein, partial [Mya arenaria]